MKENYGEENLTPKDKNEMANLLNEAKDVFNNPEKFKKEKKDELLKKKILQVLENQYEESRNDTSVILNNVRRGTVSEIFYRTLIKEIPELGILIKDDAKDINGTELPNHITIKKTSFEIDERFINSLIDNPVIKLFTFEEQPADKKEEIGDKLERSGLLPIGTTYRLLSRDYKKQMDTHPQFKNIFEERYSKFKNEEPLSDEEILEIMRKVIKEEYNKKP